MKFSYLILLFLPAIILFSGCHHAAPAPTPPVLNSVALSDTTDGSTSTTDDLTVSVGLSATGSPTQMMLSETSDFTGKRTPSWGDYLAAATFTFTGSAGTKTLYCKVKNSAGESNAASQSITYAPPSPPPPPPPTPPEWFTWWGGRPGHDLSSSNCVMLDENAPLNDKSAGWIGIYRYEGTQNDPEHITTKLNERLGQGFTKAFFEVERALSRPEIIALNNWATAHPDFKIFLWMLSYQWVAPYGTEPTQTYFTEQNHRTYTYWDEYQNSPGNVIFCFEVYFSMNAAAIVTDFTNDTLAASEENTWIQQNYLALINTFGLKDQSLIVISLGGEKSQNPNFDLNDLTREMNLCKAELPLGIGFYGTTDGWHSPGFIEAADNFCTAWENE